MVEHPGRAGFLLESPQPFRIGRKARRQNLYRNLAAQPGVPGTVDLAHPALPKQRENLIPVQAGSDSDRYQGRPFRVSAECTICMQWKPALWHGIWGTGALFRASLSKLTGWRAVINDSITTRRLNVKSHVERQRSPRPSYLSFPRRCTSRPSQEVAARLLIVAPIQRPGLCPRRCAPDKALCPDLEFKF